MPRRDLLSSLGIVMMAIAVGIQMPQRGEVASDQLLMTAPLIALGAIFLCFKLSIPTRVAAAASGASALWVLAARQAGEVRPDEILLFAAPLAIAASLAICKNRGASGVVAMISSVVMAAMVVTMAFAPWSDLTMIIFVAGMLALRSGPLPGARFI